MKKLFCIVIMLITLCGCGSENRIVPVLKGIAFDASVDFNGEKFAYTAEICDDGSMSAYLTDPTELSGMTIKFDDGDITAEYMGLDYEAKLKQREIVREVGSADTLTQALIDRLISKVYIFPGNRIEIEYVTQDFLGIDESGKEA